MKHNNPFAWLMAIAIAGTMMTACSLGSNELDKPIVIIDPVEEVKLAVCGISEPGTRSDGYEQLLFTEQDIEWFDVGNHEIMFRKMYKQPYEIMEPFREIKFYLGDRTLFVCSFVSDWDSRVYTNLVLHYDVITNPNQVHYYLQDCYPPQIVDTDEVKANIKKNAEQWELFTSYLEFKGKLRR